MFFKKASLIFVITKSIQIFVITKSIQIFVITKSTQIFVTTKSIQIFVITKSIQIFVITKSIQIFVITYVATLEMFLKTNNPASIYLLKINYRNARKRSEICSKLIIKTPERRHWRRSGVVIVNFEHISHLSLVLLLLLWTSKSY